MALAAPAPSLALVNRDSDTWLDDLRGTGTRREAATAELHTLLLRAARFELARRRSALADLDAREIDDLAVQSANDALMAVLRKLDTYRGQSRFTTWAYKFALLEAGVKARRRAWRDRELAISDDHWALIAAEDPAPDAVAGTAA